MTIDQISVFLENRPGRLAEITEYLGEAKIDLRAMSIADTADFGILRLIVDRPDDALAILKEKECIVTVTPVIAVSIDDSPGSLAKALRLFADADITIEYLYAFITHKKEHAYVIFRVEDNDKAIKLLNDNGMTIAKKDEIYQL